MRGSLDISDVKAAGVALAILILALVLAWPVSAVASSSFTWTGDATASGWSAAKNWAGETAPSNPGPVALDFPRIPSCTGACYKSNNDVSGLNVESISVDDGDEYELEGAAITLAGGGLTASPAGGTSGPAGDFIGLPIALGASAQTWSVAGRSGGAIGENGVFVEGDVTGAGKALAMSIGNGAAVYLANKTEVGPVAFDGANTSEQGALNGFVGLLGADVDSEDGSTVSLSHIFFLGSGAVGALTTSDAELGVGSGSPTGGIQARSVTLDAASQVQFEISGSGVVADTDYSQLTSNGPVALNGASVGVVVAPASGNCPELTPGRTYTFVSTTGGLSGSFGNAAEGAELPLRYAKGCAKQGSKHLQVAYHESGAEHTVTAAVVESSGPAQPTSEGTSTSPGAIQQLPVNLQIEKEFHEHPPWAKAPGRSPGGVSLLGRAEIVIERARTAHVRLSCAASNDCTGKLILTVKMTSKTRTGKKRSRTLIVGTAKFSISAGTTATIKIALNELGRGLLGKGHGRFIAHVAILNAVPGLAK